MYNEKHPKGDVGSSQCPKRRKKKGKAHEVFASKAFEATPFEFFLKPLF